MYTLTDGSGTNSESAAEESTSLEQPLHKQQQHQHKPKAPLRGASGTAHAAGQQQKKHQE